jgi:hypothetical protein
MSLRFQIQQKEEASVSNRSFLMAWAWLEESRGAERLNFRSHGK